MTVLELARLRSIALPPAPNRVLVDRTDLVSAVAEIDLLRNKHEAVFKVLVDMALGDEYPTNQEIDDVVKLMSRGTQ